MGCPIIKDRVWFYVGFAPILSSERHTRIVSRQVDVDQDGVPDVIPGTEQAVFEEVDRSEVTISNQEYQFAGKLNFAVDPDHQGSVSLTGTSIDLHNLNHLDGTPTGSQNLEGRQSLGMGEGWGDFLASSFLNNPVGGAYVTGNATRGIRRFPMDHSPFTYNEIKNGTLVEAHDVGELWAATLWDIRTAVAAATAEQLVVSGMKLMPCNPTMLNARDAILQADENIYGGVHRCQLWRAFAGRLMGVDAQSPNDNSTSTIETSIFIPVTCLDLVLPPFIFFPACGSFCDLPKNHPGF